MQNYQEIQRNLRTKILTMYKRANAGHIACSLSCIDLMIASLILEKEENEQFILSKGHAAVALYVSLNYLGEISDEELLTFYIDGTRLSAHPSANKFKNIPFALGSLGHGLPIASGIAKANKILKSSDFCYVLMSDGETNEGTTWEAMHFAVQNQLDNLIVMIDKNRVQGFGYLQDVLGDTANPKVWKEIGFEVYEIGGHDVAQIRNTIQHIKSHQNKKPSVIIANTIKGKGVSYMENTIDWHYLPMNDEQYQSALEEVNHQK